MSDSTVKVNVSIEDIPQAVRRIRAATLRDLAARWYDDDGPWQVPHLSMSTWLREQADAIEAEESA